MNMHLQIFIWILQVTILVLVAVSKGTAGNFVDCGGNLTESNGQILSPGYPEQSPHYVDCTWRIKAPEEQVIRLTFSDFSLENSTKCQLDYVSVEEMEGDIIGKFCRTANPPVITSVNNTMIVKFHTDETVVSNGFKARYEFLPKTHEICGGNSTENNSEISSPRYPEQYPPNVDCTWLITAPEMYVIRLRFSSFWLGGSTNCSHDYVWVEETEGDTIGKFCSSVNPDVITSVNSSLIVKFHSDSMNGGHGFKARYEFLPKTTEVCGGNLTQNNGVISSPRYPAQYPPNVDCTWLILAPVTHTIQLIFTSFRLERSNACVKDYVWVKETELDRPTKFCGSRFPPSVITSKSNTLMLNFHSDRSLAGDGFRATYCFFECGGNRSDNNGDIFWPRYSKVYPYNVDCSWQIKAPEGYIIRLTFSHFVVLPSTDCRYRYVSVEETEGDIIRKFCGAVKPPVITSVDNTMIFKFHTEGNSVGSSFQARYEFLPKA